MRSVFYRSISIACALWMSVSAQAQNTRASSASADPQATRPAPPTSPAEGAANDTTVDTGDAYQRGGGSLMRASRGAAASPNAGESQVDPRIADISFFAVPPPPRRIIRQHDLITIIIKEQSEFKSEGTAKLDKKADLSAAINQFIKLNFAKQSLDNGVGAVTPKIDLQGDMSFDGKGSAERKDSMSVRLQAEVVDVKPNGNLVLQARRRIKSDDEDTLFKVSGIVRVQDVTTDNSVLSTQIYDFDLSQETKGTVRESTKRGWLPRLLDMLNPF